MNKKIRVLYIDDNPMDRALVRDSLEKEHGGFILTEAKSKTEFEALIHNQEFDLVLTDFNILGFEGLQVLETVKTILPGVPVIIVTGTGSEEIAVKAMKQGVGDYVIKSPQHMLRLPQTIISVLEFSNTTKIRLNAEKKLAKMNRVYAVISQINQIIVRTNNQEILFKEACEIAVKYGNFSMAWVGLIDEENSTLKPFCWSGFEEEYLSIMKTVRLDSSPEGRGPGGNAIRNNKYSICNDIENDPSMSPWKKEALARKYRSLIVLPFKLKGKSIGTFNLYSTEPNFFDPQEVVLLEEVVDDISFALDSIFNEAERKKTEADLLKSRNELLEYWENDISSDYLISVAGEIVHCNQTFLNLFGFKDRSAVNKFNFTQLYKNPDERNALLTLIQQNKKVENFEVDFVSVEGKIIHAILNVIGIFNASDELTHTRSYLIDITKLKKSLHALSLSEERFRSVAESAKDAIITANSDGIILDWNRSAEKIFGYTDAEIAGKPLNIIIPPEYFDAHNQGMLNVSGKGVHNVIGKTVELKGLHKSGKIFPLELSLSEWEISSGKHYTGIIRDITERKRAEQIQNISFGISNAVIATENLEQLIILIQNELSKIIDTSNFYIAFYNENSGMLSAPYVSDENDTNIEWPAEKSVTGLVIKQNKGLLLKRKDLDEFLSKGEINLIGMKAECWMGVPLCIQEKVLGAFVVQSYVDENAYSESDLKLLSFIADNISIAVIRKKSQEDLIVALNKAEESNRLKSAFLANISHEIRTPMNGIIGFAELLNEPDLSGEEQKSYIGYIAQGCNRMLNIITDIVDISKIEANQLTVHTSNVNITQRLEYFNDLLRIEAAAKNVLLKLDSDPTTPIIILDTDKEKFDSIISKLVKNAIKYTDSGTINFGFKQSGDFLEFYVKDTGIGIPSDRIEAIFERFIQADIADLQARQGAGLGLSISKSFVEALGGTIWVESKLGAGSTFYFTIPHMQKDISINLDSKKPKTKRTTDSKNLRVIIAEDDEASQEVLAHFIADFCSEIHFAETGREAIKLCNDIEGIDLILMDIQMPDINGYEATHQIRSFNKDVVIIAQTSFALSGDKEKALAAGCNDYISKPIDKSTLLKIISNYL